MPPCRPSCVQLLTRSWILGLCIRRELHRPGEAREGGLGSAGWPVAAAAASAAVPAKKASRVRWPRGPIAAQGCDSKREGELGQAGAGGHGTRRAGGKLEACKPAHQSRIAVYMLLARQVGYQSSLVAAAPAWRGGAAPVSLRPTALRTSARYIYTSQPLNVR